MYAVWLHNKCHKIYLSGRFGIFCLYVILTISYLRAQTIETSSLPTPVQANRDFFSILIVLVIVDTTAERVSGKVSNINQRFVNSCLSKCLYIHSWKHLITSPVLNKCLLVHNFQNNCSTECHCVTQKRIEVWLHDKCHKIYLSGPFGIFCLYVIQTISYLGAQTIETSSLPTDSSQPQFEQIEIFSSILTVYLNCKYCP